MPKPEQGRREQYNNVDILSPKAPPLVGGIAFVFSPRTCAGGI
ncbi:MAG: hypothetical protein WBC22_03500 [Sedimentisphaerales bacterium]